MPMTIRLAVPLLLLAGCGADPTTPTTAARDAVAELLAPALVAHAGVTPVDIRIREAQDRVTQRADLPSIERLAAAWIAKARLTGDAGYYKLAERCADGIAARTPGEPAALLLRGHVLHAMHRFAEAERIARDLVGKRGLHLDHGLLGDVLLDQGQVREALDSYNQMLQQRPGLQGFARAAQVRWLRGDVDGTRQLLEMARGAGSGRDPESLAWVECRLAALDLHVGDLAAAAQRADAALLLVTDFAPGLLARGRVQLANGELAAAATTLAAAARACPLPEFLWAHADAARAAGDEVTAVAVEAELERTGAAEDPRTFALYLASRGRSLPQALLLVQNELRQRTDVFTHDAHAWSLLRAGDLAGAKAATDKALAEGTLDARLLLHAGAVALACGDRDIARERLARARAHTGTLLPGERQELERLHAAL
ncbi:MAG: hypothetical protein IPK26_09030 [Planctomycetes bacterium]|nr:hypothetical protein [Planctomycetota bacterium]